MQTVSAIAPSRDTYVPLLKRDGDGRRAIPVRR